MMSPINLRNGLFIFVISFLSIPFALGATLPHLNQCQSDPLNIPDNDGENLTITFPANVQGTIKDVNVLVDVTHNYIGELVLELAHNGKRVTLLNQPRSQSDPDILCVSRDIPSITFDDEAHKNIQTDCHHNQIPAYNSKGSYAPKSALSQFDTPSPEVIGTWTLTVKDTGDLGSGQLQNWCLDIEYLPDPRPIYNSNPIDPGEDITFTDQAFIGEEYTQPIEITNNGNMPLRLISAEIIGNHGEFSVDLPSGSFPLEIDVDDSQILNVTCSPQTFGLRETILKLSTNDLLNEEVSYNLKCSGLGAKYESVPPPPGPIDFGATYADNSVKKTIIITNTGNHPLAIDLRVRGPNEPPQADKEDFLIIKPRELEVFEEPNINNESVFPVKIDSNGTMSFEIECKPNGDKQRKVREYELEFLAGNFNPKFDPTDMNNDNTPLLRNEVYEKSLSELSNDPSLRDLLKVYKLVCTVTEDKIALLQSKPSLENPEPTIDFGSIKLGDSGQKDLVIVESGTANLTVESYIKTGPDEDRFTIDFSSFILTGGSRDEWAINIQCTPDQCPPEPQACPYTAQLELQTNASNYPNPTYQLKCAGLRFPIYTSSPDAGNTINWGPIEVGQSIQKTINIKNVGTGSLLIESMSLTNKTIDFADPIINKTTIPANKPAQITLACQPTAIGEFETRLKVETNDPNKLEVLYDLQCQGVPPTTQPIGPAYRSQPEPNSDIVTHAKPGQTALLNLNIQEVGTAPLFVHLGQPAMIGPDVDKFNLLNPEDFPLVFSDGSMPKMVQIECQPPKSQNYHATLRFTTNDEKNKEIFYNLVCIGDTLNTGGMANPSLPQTMTLTIKTEGLGSGQVNVTKEGFVEKICDNNHTICSYTFKTGSVASLTPNPAVGSTFDYWAGSDEDCVKEQMTLLNNHVCTAHFGVTPKILKVTFEGQGRVITQPQGIDCGVGFSQCVHLFDGASVVNLITQPQDGWHLSTWGGDCDNTGHVQMLTNKTCHAVFVKTTLLSLTTRKIGTGKGVITSEPAGIHCGSECLAAFPAQTTVNLTARPQPGSLFKGWSEDCTETTQSTLVILDSDKTCQAQFDVACPLTTRLYVNKQATGSNIGCTWTNAFIDLQSALKLAADGTFPNIEEIWVAQGTYKPTQSTDRAATFQLVNGVAVYGGFEGVETDLEQHNHAAYPTFLSGDIGQPDQIHDNSYHVVTGSGTDATAILNGFIITQGNADGAEDCPNACGGGIFNDHGSPTLEHLAIVKNWATYGGGMLNWHHSAPRIKYSFIEKNTAHYGGGIMNRADSNPNIRHVFISNNVVHQDGGGLMNTADSDAILSQVNLNGNSATRGGGIFNDQSHPQISHSILTANMASQGGGLFNKNSQLLLSHVILTHNSAIASGGAMLNENSAPMMGQMTISDNTASLGGGIANLSSYPLISNSILWANIDKTTDPSSQLYDDMYSTSIVKYSIVQGGWPGQGNKNEDPLFAQIEDQFTAHSAVNDFHLQPGSPAIDAGNNLLIPRDFTDAECYGSDGNTTELVAFDFDCRLRFVDGNQDKIVVVDMGAYEALANPFENFDLEVSLVGQGDGTISSNTAGIDCKTQDSNCVQKYPNGTEVILIAHAGTNSQFAGWICDGQKMTHSHITMSMTGNQNCQAIFEPIPFNKGLDNGSSNNGGSATNNLGNSIMGWDNSTGLWNDATGYWSNFIGNNGSQSTEGSDSNLTGNSDDTMGETATGEGSAAEEEAFSPNYSLTILACFELNGRIERVCNAHGETLYDVTIGTKGDVSDAVLKGVTTNEGWLGNITLSPDSRLVGRDGSITGYIDNQGVIEGPIYFRGAKVNGVFSGQIINDSPMRGIIENPTFLADAELIRGDRCLGCRLSGKITGDASKPARLENQTIMAGSELENLVLEDCNLLGQQSEPITLNNVKIAAGSYLENVIIGGNVEIAQGVIRGPGVKQAEGTTENPLMITQKIDGQGETFKNIVISSKGQLSKATLAGQNKVFGTLIDVQLAVDTITAGGQWQGSIEGQTDKSPKIEEATIKHAEVSGVTLGHHLKIENSTVADSNLLGAYISIDQGTLKGVVSSTVGSTLEGTIILAPNTYLTGVNLAKCDLIGDQSAPALLENVRIATGCSLQHVKIGENVELAEDIQLEQVAFLHPPVNTQWKNTEKQSDITTAVRIDGQGNRVQISDLEFSGNIIDRCGNKQENHALLTDTEAEQFKVSASITVRPEDVGKAGQLLIVRKYQESYDMRVGSSWKTWNRDIKTLKAFEARDHLSNKENVILEENLSRQMGEYKLYVGYLLKEDGSVICSNCTQPLHFFVDSAPEYCVVYAVHDAGLNNSQFIQIDLSADEGLAGLIAPLGTLHEGLDIEGMAQHQANPELLYGTAGNNAAKQTQLDLEDFTADCPKERRALLDGQKPDGFLYEIERQSGKICPVGPTGFNSIPALAYNRVDNRLWGWATNHQDQLTGLVKIDPKTGKGQLVQQFEFNDYRMAGLTWSYDGKKLYTSKKGTLWVYDRQSHQLKEKCANVAQNVAQALGLEGSGLNNGKIEALATQPNGSLLLSVDYGRLLVDNTQSDISIIAAYDPQTCQTTNSRIFKDTPYSDMESILWPLDQCNDQSWLPAAYTAQECAH